jgi:hypothetical protein
VPSGDTGAVSTARLPASNSGPIAAETVLDDIEAAAG